MRPRCPQCGGQPSYEEGGTYVCMMGGHRWPINGAKPIIVYKRSEEEEMESKKTPAGKVGICTNCEREKFIADGAGLCSSCHNAVKGISKDSVAYTAALADAKKHLTNNPTRRGRVAKAKAMAAAPVKRTKPDPVTVSIKEIGPSVHDDIVKILSEHYEFHLTAADKLKQAITLLS